MIRLLKIVVFGLALFICAILSFTLVLYFNLPDVSPLAYSNPSTTTYIELYKADQSFVEMDFKLQWKWVPLGKISPYVIHSINFTEDNHFWTHRGIDWEQVLQAFKIMWQAQRIVTGASTITQQVAKNLYLSSDRTFLRKFREVLIARELEKHLSKERILEIYLNIAEWGDGIFGIEAASQFWYQCAANELNPKQAINLAFALPNPHQRNPTKLSPRLNMYVNMLLLKFAQKGVIPYEEAMGLLNLPEGYQN